jgi:rhomboid protease GluP
MIIAARSTPVVRIRELPARFVCTSGSHLASYLTRRYPRDPRSHLMRALALLDGNDTTGAEQQLRTALSEKEILKTKFAPGLESQIRTLLALILIEKEPAEAKAIALPVCAASPAGPKRDELIRQQLCERG